MSESAEYIALDFETTGLSPANDRIVEVGAWRFDAAGRDLGTFQSLVNPRRPVGLGAMGVHGLSDELLATADDAAVVLPKFLAWMDETPGATLLAHNAGFDAAFLGAELERLGTEAASAPREIVDTLALARKLAPGPGGCGLDALSARLNLSGGDRHRALADAGRVRGLWMAITAGACPDDVLRYPVKGPSIDGEPPAPSGFEILAEAIAARARVRIRYTGGSRGDAPREITPRRFRHMGGVAYVVAVCHVSSIEKMFRLDRVAVCERL
jgi:DNA polymerase III epsilon subunit family exonuclease